jgi:hypothetical protein
LPLNREQLRALSKAFPSRGASRHDPTGHETLRAGIVAAIEPFADALEFDLDTVESLTQADLAPLPSHILLVWCEADEAMAYLYAIPEAELNEGLAQALVMLEGCSFAGPADLSPEQWGAALRLMAAIATPYARDPQDFFDHHVNVDGAPLDAVPDLPEVAALFDQFAACFVEGGAGLSRRFSRVITVLRGDA